MDRLAAEREVVAVDMPGFGESPELPEGVEPRAANLATAVLDFYDSLGIDGKPAVAGISLGGWTSIECARQGGASAVVALCPAGFWKRSPERLEPGRRAGETQRPGCERAAAADHVDGSRPAPRSRPVHLPARAPQPRRGRRRSPRRT